MKKIKTTNYTADKLWNTIDELETLENKEDLIRNWVSNSDISLTWDDGQVEPLVSYVGRLNINSGRMPSKDELIAFLRNLAGDKEKMKAFMQERNKKIANYGGAGFGFKGQPVLLELSTELLKINKHDFSLFSNMRQCGSSLILKNMDDVLLCVEDGKGHVKISAEKFLKGSIARTVKEDFEFKVRHYLKIMNDFVQNLDKLKEEDVGTSPVEDMLSTEVPASLAKMFDLYDYVREHEIGKKTILEHNYKWRLKKPIGTFDDLFDWALDNWKKFNKCIHGEEHFYAWSNDRNVTAASYWFPQEQKHCPDVWKKFLKEKMDVHLMKRLVCYLGMICDASNRSQQYLIISGQGGEGKDFMEKVLASVLPKNSVSNLDTSALANDDRFGLANREIWKSHLSIIHELNNAKNLQSEKAKQYFAQNSMDLEVKNAGVVSWEPINHKTIVNSNTKISIKEFANRRRCIPVVFNNKLKWSQDLEDEMKSTAVDFLNYCYTYYKQCPLVKDGQYIVLSDEDEKAYLAGTLDLNNVKPDNLSKKAFSEECLKDYYSTDEYTEDDIVYDIFEPLLNDMFEITNDEEDLVSNKIFKELFIRTVAMDDEYCAAFEVRQDPQNHSKLLNFYPFKNTTYWKFTKYLKDKYGLECKRFRTEGELGRGWRGIKIKVNSQKPSNGIEKFTAPESTNVDKVDQAMNGSSWTAPEHTAEEKASMDEFADLLVG